MCHRIGEYISVELFYYFKRGLDKSKGVVITPQETDAYEKLNANFGLIGDNIRLENFVPSRKEISDILVKQQKFLSVMEI